VKSAVSSVTAWKRKVQKMAEVKWIKLSTELFNNRKIRQIECLPEGNALIVMWVRLLCLAGNTNDSGQIYFTKEIPYTDQMLATQFNMPLTTVQLALKIFSQFEMIEVIDNMLQISNWEKYQSVDRLSEIREYNRIAKQKSREKKKLLQSNVIDMSKTSQSCHDTDIDKDKDKEIDIDNNIFVSAETKTPKKEKPVKHKYGEYKNVLLTDDELEKLKTEYSDYENRIERLSGYIASTGKAYKSHYATIRNWAKKDTERPQQATQKQQVLQPIPKPEEYKADFW
jgi:predicted phage replisome organizer